MQIKRILIIAGADSPHVMNFIKIVLGQSDAHIVVFNTGNSKYVREEYLRYFKEKNIELLNTKPTKIKNRFFFYLTELVKYAQVISGQRKFDVCMIHFLARQRIIVANIFHRKFRKLILIAHGSDILRNNNLGSIDYRMAFRRCNNIVLPNMNTQQVFKEKTGNKFKSRMIPFPQSIVEALKETERTINLEKIKREFNLPIDKYIIICGHTATREEQYEKMIMELKKIPEDVLDKCYFVFMMTYGSGDTVPYKDEIQRQLDNTQLSYVILREYIPYSDILKLHFVSDIHITMIKTDAFSCFLQEELFAGATIIYGKWLNYYEIEDGNWNVFAIDKFEELSENVKYIIENIQEIKVKNKKNRDGILMLKISEEEVRKQWQELLEEL